LIHIEEPTVKMIFMVNNSPFAGKEGEFLTTRQIKARLFKELDTDVSSLILFQSATFFFLIEYLIRS